MSGSRGTSALALVGGVLLIAIGAFVLAQSLDELPAAVLGLLMMALGVESLALAGVRAGVGRGSQARLRSRDDGSTVTSVQAPVLTVVLPLAALAAAALACLVWSWAAWSDANPLLGVILAVLGLWCLVVLVVPLLRGARPDRVDLSSAAISAEHFGRRVVVPWEDVYGCVPPDAVQPMALVLRDGHEPQVTSRGWPLWRHPSAPDTVEPVVVRDLRVRPELLARVVALCAEDPSLRATLGTEGSRDWLTFPPVRDAETLT